MGTGTTLALKVACGFACCALAACATNGTSLSQGLEDSGEDSGSSASGGTGSSRAFDGSSSGDATGNTLRSVTPDASSDGGVTATSDAEAGSGDAGTSSGPGDASAREAGDGTVPYNPCPSKGNPCVILPVGDSITAGSQSSTGGGYRLPLFHLANVNRKSLTFVGANRNGPASVDGVPFPSADSGYSGYEIDGVNGRQGISQFFPAQITQYKPNIILLMIGTNDVASGVPDIPPRLGTLMDTILSADPALLLVVAQIVPQQKATPDAQNMLVQAYNSAIQSLVKARVDAGKHVTMVDMYSALTAIPNYSTADFANTLHPNDSGYEVMGETWYAAIGPLLR
jgi:lysophospholipase L1-like esterase